MTTVRKQLIKTIKIASNSSVKKLITKIFGWIFQFLMVQKAYTVYLYLYRTNGEKRLNKKPVAFLATKVNVHVAVVLIKLSGSVD